MPRSVRSSLRFRLISTPFLDKFFFEAVNLLLGKRSAKDARHTPDEILNWYGVSLSSACSRLGVRRIKRRPRFTRICSSSRVSRRSSLPIAHSLIFVSESLNLVVRERAAPYGISPDNGRTFTAYEFSAYEISPPLPSSSSGSIVF
jgi:hypothetical protein